jgi:hypothetical protein
MTLFLNDRPVAGLVGWSRKATVSFTDDGGKGVKVR